jgi:hypothetical protein
MTKEPTDRDITKAALYDCLRPEIRKMAHQMEQKFRLHDVDRGDPFKCDDFPFMRERIRGETKEMYDAIEQKKSPSEVWKEAADRCNLITMEAVAYEKIWGRDVNARRRTKKRD